MIGYESVRSTHDAQFHVSGRTLIVTSTDPMGGTLVLYDPYVEDGRVVLTAGIASGGGGERTRCFELRAKWPSRLAWRERDGSLARISDVQRASDTLVAHCSQAQRQQQARQ